MNILGWLHREWGGKTKTSKRRFTDKEKKMLRPIAEVIAILDGNAFWGLSVDDTGEDNWYEQYLPEAWMIYRNNPSVISGTSWHRDHINHENETVRDAYNNWQLLKMLAVKRD
jgi:hypothetical protein